MITASCLHYYLYKRTALCISDPKFYTDEWINHRINQEPDQRSPKYWWMMKLDESSILGN